MQQSVAARRSAIVVGGSLGGLLAANLLHRQGWDVRVVERVGEELVGRGAGIVTHPELDAVLARIDIRPEDGVGVPVAGRVAFARDGSVLGRLPLPQVTTAWGRLYALLRAAFPADRYAFARGVERVATDDDAATLHFADGTSMRADLVVAADGIRSTIRAQLAPAAEPVYAGYVAWRGLVDEAALSPATHAAIFESFAFSLPEQEQMLGYPVAGAGDSVRPGERRYNFVWYRPADAEAALPRLLTDTTGRRHAHSIPPNLLRPEAVAEVRRAAREVLAPQFAEVVEKTAQPLIQPIFDLESERLAFGRVVLLGDAAFVARPHCGMGVTKAGGDARSLADALAATPADIPAALARYERERLDFGRRAVAHARHLGAYMQAQLRTPEERAMAERYRTPEAVMRETAVPF
jgi:2-polyprenyl-6-methoxyphenol hydroxylase-like FAD-dependent oxidoreductase